MNSGAENRRYRAEQPTAATARPLSSALCVNSAVDRNVLLGASGLGGLGGRTDVRVRMV